MVIFLVGLLCDNFLVDQGPTGSEMLGFAIVSLIICSLLLVIWSRKSATLKPKQDFIKSDVLIPVVAEFVEDESPLELKKHSIFTRVLAIGLIILILAAPCIDLTKNLIFAG